MADLGMNLDHESIERGLDFSPIPAGEYLAQIKASDVVLTKAGDGKMAKFTFEVVAGPYERRIVFDQVNYQNPNPTAQLIGQQRIKAICEAVGHRGPLRDTSSVESRPMIIRVAIETDKNGVYAPKNVIKGVKAADAGRPPPGVEGGGPASPVGSPPHRSGGAAAPPPRATAGASAGPWRR